ncbi:MAG: hypothetical protein VX740_05875, partial [Pseudomonadota bacterium]|nr:hypothetical protein [Pseudomonadota bacterium]
MKKHITLSKLFWASFLTGFLPGYLGVPAYYVGETLSYLSHETKAQPDGTAFRIVNKDTQILSLEAANRIGSVNDYSANINEVLEKKAPSIMLDTYKGKYGRTWLKVTAYNHGNDADYIASGDSMKNLCIRKISDGSEHIKKELKGAITSISFSPNNTDLAI